MMVVNVFHGAVLGLVFSGITGIISRIPICATNWRWPGYPFCKRVSTPPSPNEQHEGLGGCLIWKGKKWFEA